MQKNDSKLISFHNIFCLVISLLFLAGVYQQVFFLVLSPMACLMTKRYKIILSTEALTHYNVFFVSCC